MDFGLAHRDDPDLLFGFGGDDDDHLAPQSTQGHKPLLAIIETTVFEGYGGFTLDNEGCIVEVEAMLLEVGHPLPRVMGVAHA